IDSSLNTAERYNVEALCEDVGEAALRQTAVDWHLAAFEAIDRDARTGLLTLDAATTGLAGARTDTATNALARLDRTWLVTQIVEFHISISLRYHASSTTRTRCGSLAIMPRTAGVSSSVLRRCILLRPRPISVARCSAGRRIGLPICSTVTVLPFFSAITQIPCLWRIRWPERPRTNTNYRLFFRTDHIMAASLKGRVIDAALCSDVLRMHLMLQSIERRTNHVVRVRRTERLGDNVLNAERFEHCTHRTTGDDTLTSRSCAKQNLTGAVTAFNIVMQRTA